MQTRGRMNAISLTLRIAGCLGLAVCVAVMVAARPAPQAANTESPCVTCHEDAVKAFGHNPHSSLGDSACASCHAGADKHLAEGGGQTILAFKATDAPQAKAKVCLTCHASQQGHFMSGPHGQASMDCTACHSMHSQPVKAGLLKASEARTCGACHAETMAKFALNERHKLQEGALACSSCHDPHAPDANQRLGGFKQETCLKCHTDKGGPFLYEHGASRIEGCTICHEAHGSPNRHMLSTQNVGDLCFSCHTFSLEWHASMNAKTTNCTTCHPTIHGSNMSRIFIK